MDWRDWSAAEREAYWTESERLLLDALADTASYLTDQQRRWVQEAIDHNEHGLALESLFDYLDELADQYSDELRSKFGVLAARIPMSGGGDVENMGN
jgi:hypothetical protein